MRAQVVLAALLTTSLAHADGVYFAESFGVGRARGALEPTVGNAIQSQLALGARIDWLAFEAFIGSNMQTDREGAFKGFAGGEPAEGRADLGSYGFAIAAYAPLHRTPNEILEGYVRVGPSIISGTGALDGYRGAGIGASAGIRISGRVRALGFLWAPLFFMKKGPKVTGSLFLDQGWDFVSLKRDDMPTIDARIGHVTIGFSIGTAL
jgi:hypothetical protein